MFHRRLKLLVAAAITIFLIHPAGSNPLDASPLAGIPTISSIAPNESYNWQSTNITITGTDFTAIPKIRLNNVWLDDIFYVDASTLTATVPANLPAGAYDLTVINPDDQAATFSDAFTVLSGVDGSLSSWTGLGEMNTPRGGHALARNASYIYALGGGTSHQDLNSVERAEINEDGSLGAWQYMTSMNMPRSYPAAAVVGDYLYAIGGGIPSTLEYSVERAPINADGSLGSWEYTHPLTVDRNQGPAAVRAGEYIYVMGGRYFSSVERAHVNPDGSIDPWERLNSMTTERDFASAILVGGAIYMIGGENLTQSLSSVERSVIQPDGSLGDWQVVNDMNKRRGNFGVAERGGFVYAMGGGGEGGASVERAQIFSNGTLSDWVLLDNLPLSRGGSAVNTESNIYIIGGNTNAPPEEYGVRARLNPPSLNAFSPNVVLFAERTEVAITGTNFGPSQTLSLENGTTLDFTFVSPTSLIATIPDGLSEGYYDATIASSGGRSGSLANAVEVVNPTPTSTDTPNPTETPVETPVPSATPTLTVTQTETRTLTPTFVASSTPTVTVTPSLCDLAPRAPRLKQPGKGAAFVSPQVVLKWKKVACAPTYRLEVRRNSRSGGIALIKTFRRKSFTANLELGRKYAWSVTACTDNGCSTSGWRKFKILAPTATPTNTATRVNTATRTRTNTRQATVPPQPTNTRQATSVSSPQPTNTQQPTTVPPQPTITKTPTGNCSPSYPTVCIPPPPPDLDCGEIPYRRFQVLPPDPHGFDGDHDGIGCEI